MATGGGNQTGHLLPITLIVTTLNERSFKNHKSLFRPAFSDYLHQFRVNEDEILLSSDCKQISYDCEFKNSYHRDPDHFFSIFLQSSRKWCDLSRKLNYRLWVSTDNEEAFSSQGPEANVHQGFKLGSFCLGAMLDRCTFVKHYEHVSPSPAMKARYAMTRQSDDKTSLLDFEHDSRFLSISFYSPSESRRVQTLVEYRLRVKYDELQKFILIHKSEQFPLTAFFMLKTPPTIQHIHRAKRSVERARVNHTSDCDANVIGNSSVFSVTLKDDYESYIKFQEALSRLRALGSKTKFRIHWSHFRVLSPEPQPNIPSFDGDFGLVYALHCLLSQGFSITDRVEDLLTRLEDLQPHEYRAAEKALQELAIETELSIEGDRFIDLASQFEIKLKSVQESGDLEEEQYANYRYVRRAIVTPTRCLLLPAELMAENRILREFGEEYCLRIVFRDENFFKLQSYETSQSGGIQRRIVEFLTAGIHVGNRHYQFLACSNSQLRDHGCWLYARDQDERTADDIRAWMGDLTHIKCVATYISRMGQCFSTSEKSVTVSVDDGEVDYEADIKSVHRAPSGKRYCFSDGIGKVSSSLANRIAKERNMKKVPSAFQIRYGGCKGMIAKDPTINGDKLIIRNSMDKFESTHEEIEVMNYSKPCRLFLNRQAITLLSGLGIPDDVFKELQENMLFDLGGMFFDDRKASESLSTRASKNANINYHQVTAAGISLTNEPFFKGLLLAVYRHWIGQLQRKASIDISPDLGRNMVGVLDETGTLRYGQVFVQYSKSTDKPQVLKQVHTGPLVVSKFPALHPGDFRKFTAVDVPALRHLVDCIVFPQKGRRPHPDEMAGSDLDGDEYFVTWMPELIFDRPNEEPMDFTAPPKKVHHGPIRESDMIEYIADYIKNDNIGVIASAHLAQADNQRDGIFSYTCKEIAEIHAVAVDFAKTGYSPDLEKEHRPRRYPDFMGKRDKSSYRSKKILGALFRQCRQIDRIAIQQRDTGPPDVPYDEGLKHTGWEIYQDEAVQDLDRYNQKLERILKQYGITSESEALSGNIRQLSKRFTQRNEIYDAKNIIGVKIRQLRNATRRAFFEEFGGRDAIGEDFPDECLAKASAWYIITYDKQENPDRKYLSFPWVVADVLCQVRKCSPAAATISVLSIKHRLSTEAEIAAYGRNATTGKLRRLISLEMQDETPQHAHSTQDVIIGTLERNPWIQTTAGILLEWRTKQSLRKMIRKWELMVLLLGYAKENALLRLYDSSTSLLPQSVSPIHANDDVAITLLIDFLSFCASRRFHSRDTRTIPQGCQTPKLSRKHVDRISNTADKAYHSLALCSTIDSMLQDYKGNTDDEIHEEVVKVGNRLLTCQDVWVRQLKEEFPNVEVSVRRLGGPNARNPDALVTIKGPPYQVDEAHERIEEWESDPPSSYQNPIFQGARRDIDDLLDRMSIQSSASSSSSYYFP